MKIDRVELHNRLWQEADRFGRVEIYQKALAEEYGVTYPTMSIAIGDLTKAGRIKKIAAKVRNVGIYHVKDPANFEHEFEGVEVPGIGVERCRVCGELFQIGFHIVGASRGIIV